MFERIIHTIITVIVLYWRYAVFIAGAIVFVITTVSMLFCISIQTLTAAFISLLFMIIAKK